jgi:hypothetical protein
MFKPIKQWLRTKRRNFLRDRVITNGQILNELRTDRAAIGYATWPEECERLDALIDNRERLADRLLAQFKEA